LYLESDNLGGSSEYSPANGIGYQNKLLASFVNEVDGESPNTNSVKKIDFDLRPSDGQNILLPSGSLDIELHESLALEQNEDN
jgi:hypothetical protein